MKRLAGESRESEERLEGIRFVNPPAYLLPRIINRIKAETELIALKRMRVCFALGSSLVSLALLGSFFLLREALAESELNYLFSLLFSDPGAVLTNWYDFGLSILESLPVEYILIFLSVALVFLFIIRGALYYSEKMFSASKLLIANRV